MIFFFAKGILCAASVSASEVNFINEDREFSCVGDNVAWYFNRQSLPKNSAKYVIEQSEEESKLTIKNIDVNDNGVFECVTSDSKSQEFKLETFCELF